MVKLESLKKATNLEESLKKKKFTLNISQFLRQKTFQTKTKIQFNNQFCNEKKNWKCCQKKQN